MVTAGSSPFGGTSSIFAGIIQPSPFDIRIPVTPTLRAGALLLASLVLVACSDSPPGPSEIGPPASMALVTATPSALANTDLTGVKIVVKDANGKPVPDQTITFTVTAGGGSIQQTSATSGTDGTVTVPAWRMGKRAEPQTLRASVNSVTFDINANITTSYNIVIRYYGTHPSDAQKVLFTNAANRIRGVVLNELQNVLAQGPGGADLDISDCLGQPAGTTRINETIDDLVIYATVISTGGSQTIASAGPCYYRNAGTDTMQTVIGVMRFSPTFLTQLSPERLQDVITHEMLHVVGVGAWWLGNNCANCNNPGWNLVADTGSIAPRFTGATARAECQAAGGTVTCANSVPVENDTTRGTGDVHWERDNFPCELMIGFICANQAMPFSRITVGSLKDIRLNVNSANFDEYAIAPFVGSALRMPVLSLEEWERPLTSPLYGLDPATGRITAVRARQ